MNLYKQCSDLINMCDNPSSASCIVTKTEIRLYCDNQHYESPDSITKNTITYLPCTATCDGTYSKNVGCKVILVRSNQVKLSSVCEENGIYYSSGSSTIFFDDK